MTAAPTPIHIAGEALTLGPDDALVIRLDKRASMQEIDDMLVHLKAALGDRRVVIIDAPNSQIVAVQSA